MADPDRTDPPDHSPMRGRAAECEAVHSLLASTANGRGKIPLWKGTPGTLKSPQLAAAARKPGAELPVVAAVADELSQARRLAPLLSAVSATASAARAAGTALTRLEELAVAGPVLVTVDDVQ